MTDSVHPTIDELADLDEGLLDAAADQRLRDHLATCTSCSADLDQLREVQTLLADAGAEQVTMPPDVVGRIDDALAAEASGKAPTVSSMAQARTERALPRKRKPWLQIMAGAAAVLVFAAFGIEGWQAMNEGGGGDTDSAGGDSAALESAPRDQPSGSQDDNQDNSAKGGSGNGSTAYELAEVTPDSLPTFARRLARTPRAETQSLRTIVSACPAAESKLAGGAIFQEVRWADRRALVVLNEDARTATVFGCGTGAPQLYSTSY